MTKQLRDEFTFPVTVEFEDVDSYQIAHHSKYVLYLERARLRYFKSLNFKLDAGSTNAVLYHLDMQFKKVARLLDELTVSVFVESVDAYRLTLGYRIRKGDELMVRAKTVLAFIDSANKELVPIPPEYLERGGWTI